MGVSRRRSNTADVEERKWRGEENFEAKLVDIQQPLVQRVWPLINYLQKGRPSLPFLINMMLKLLYFSYYVTMFFHYHLLIFIQT